MLLCRNLEDQGTGLLLRLLEDRPGCLQAVDAVFAGACELLLGQYGMKGFFIVSCRSGLKVTSNQRKVGEVLCRTWKAPCARPIRTTLVCMALPNAPHHER